MSIFCGPPMKFSKEEHKCSVCKESKKYCLCGHVHPYSKIYNNWVCLDCYNLSEDGNRYANLIPE